MKITEKRLMSFVARIIMLILFAGVLRTFIGCGVGSINSKPDDTLDPDPGTEPIEDLPLDLCESCYWRHPSSLTDNISPDGQNVTDLKVAMSDDGYTLIVWTQSDGSNAQIYKSEYLNGAWTHPTSLADNISPDGQDTSSVQLAMNAGGEALIVWQQNNGTANNIYKSERRNGAWIHPSSLADRISPNGGANNPQVAIDVNGNALIVWRHFDGSVNRVMKSEYRNGAWTHPSSSGEGIQFLATGVTYPIGALGDNGDGIIMWRQNDGSRFRIFKSERRNGVWIPPASALDGISHNGSDASNFIGDVEMDAQGNAILVWIQPNILGWAVAFKSEYRNGTWTHPSSISDHISYATAPLTEVSLEMDKLGGDAVVVYETSIANGLSYKSEYRNGTWTHPTAYTNYLVNSSYVNNPRVAINHLGRSIFVCSVYDGSSALGGIYKAEYRDHAWFFPSSSTTINQSDQSSFITQVAINQKNRAIIVWVDSDGASMQLYKSEFR